MEAASVDFRNTIRAVHVQLAGARKTKAVALVSARIGPCRGLPKCPHAHIQCVRDDVICLAGYMPVDDRRVDTVVAHPRHEVTRAHSGCSRESVPRVPQIVKVKSRRTDGLDSLKPAHQRGEVAAPDWSTFGPRETNAVGSDGTNSSR